MISQIRSHNGRPTLFVNGRQVPAMAYTTYFEERSCYADFVKAGYRIFFVNLSLTAGSMNSAVTGMTPFMVGAFEDPENPDYSEFEDAVYKILKACPDAMIFPRIYVSMPKWWCDSHPEDTVQTKGGRREVLFSEKFREDGKKFLLEAVRHIQNADYADNVAGWQLCGGQTQEWFLNDLAGSFSPAAERAYQKWIKETYGEDGAVLPDPEDYLYKGRLRCENQNALRYAEFSSLAVSETLEQFAHAVKVATGRTQVVGTFYGYMYEVRDPFWACHGMWRLLPTEDLDFYSSPNGYTAFRAMGIDWADMIPVDTLKRHDKLCFIECDIRTFLTKSIQESRPGIYPADIYPVQKGNDLSVWSGPTTPELSREALRKSFAHQLCKASGIWWFDMFGGWYAHPVLMEEMEKLNRIARMAQEEAQISLHSPVVFFGDERAHANICRQSPANRAVIETRLAMGNIGTPYDCCMVEEAEWILDKYQAAVFPSPIPSKAGLRAMELCREKGIPYLAATQEHHTFTTEQIVSFLQENKVHLYCTGGDVVYAGNGFVALHAARGGEKQLDLPAPCGAQCLFGTEVYEVNNGKLRFALPQYGTALFYLKKLDSEV